MKLRNLKHLLCAILTGVTMLFTSCEECDHEGDRSIASSLQIGDVVCSDGSVLSKEKFSSSKKEPVAIVYHVNRNPEIKALGYAVSIWDVAPAAFADSLGVEQETSASLEKEDGNENTHAMYRNEEVKSPLAVYVFDMWRYGQAAYIPSVKQLTYLYQQIGLVNQRIEAIGGFCSPVTAGCGLPPKWRDKGTARPGSSRCSREPFRKLRRTRRISSDP